MLGQPENNQYHSTALKNQFSQLTPERKDSGLVSESKAMALEGKIKPNGHLFGNSQTDMSTEQHTGATHLHH